MGVVFPAGFDGVGVLFVVILCFNVDGVGVGFVVVGEGVQKNWSKRSSTTALVLVGVEAGVALGVSTSEPLTLMLDDLQTLGHPLAHHHELVAGRDT